MRHIQLKAVEDSDHGMLGLVVKDRKTGFCNRRFTAMSGDVLAHDIIEHQQGFAKIGSIGDEMLALGAICFTRGQFGDLAHQYTSTYSVEENIASDVLYMGRLFLQDSIPFRQPLKQTKDNPLQALIQGVIDYSRDAIWQELDEKDVTQEDIDTYLEGTRLLMVQGAYMARRRFDSALIANNMYWNIREATHPYASNLEYEGQTFRLSYDKYSASCEEIHPYDY